MILLHKATLVTGEKEAKGSILINGDRIEAIYWENEHGIEIPEHLSDVEVVDLEGKHDHISV